jgi:hypothetical protein
MQVESKNMSQAPFRVSNPHLIAGARVAPVAPSRASAFLYPHGRHAPRTVGGLGRVGNRPGWAFR